MFFQKFWHAFSYMQNSKIEELTQKEGVTIEDFLDEESILSEIKTGPQKFSDFIIKNPNKIKQLIDYCIQEQSVIEQGNDYNSCLKYPFVASEIFAAQPPNLASFLFGQYTPEEEEEEEQEKEQDKAKEQIKSQWDDDSEDKEQENNNDRNNAYIQYDSDDENKKDSDSEGEEKAKKDTKKNDEELVEGETDKKQDDNNDEETKENNDGEQKETQDNEEEQKENVEDQQQEQKEEEETKQPAITGPELLDHIFQFLERDDKHDHFATSSGYFCKILGMLISKEGYLWNYLVENPGVKQNLLKHIDNKSIAEIVLKIIINDGINSLNDSDCVSDKQENYVEQRKKLIDELLLLFDKTDDQESLENISYIITEVISQIEKYKEETKSQKIFIQLGEQVYEPENLKILLDKLKSEDSFITQYTAAIINALIIMFSDSKSSGDMSDDEDVVSDESNNYQLQFEALSEKISCLIEVIREDSVKADTQSTAYGENIKPFGLGRLKIIEIFTNLLKCKSPQIYSTIAKSDLYSILFSFFEQYPWNNLLHNLIDKVVVYTVETENQELIKSMLDQSNMIKLIISGSPNNDKESENQPHLCLPGTFKNKISRGISGFLTKFANIFNGQVEKQNEPFVAYFAENESWQAYIQNSLKETNKIEKDTQLGGPTNQTENSESDQKEDELDINIQRIYEKFHQYFATSQPQDSGNKEGEGDENKEKDMYEDWDQENEIPSLSQDNQEQQQDNDLEQKNLMEDNWCKKEIESNNPDYNSTAFWKQGPKYQESDIDDILSDL